MSNGRPTVEIVEEGMREGMQIESAAIPVEAKIRLLDALSRTGLRTIVVGSFVSPKWVPQMAHVDDVVTGFTPHPGVRYTALALNRRGVERRSAFMPPLQEDAIAARSMLHLCDVFVQRNTARTTAQEREALPGVVREAAASLDPDGPGASIGVNAAWGSNWLGPFDEAARTAALQVQHDAWTAAGVDVRAVYLGDPMSWNTPGAVRSQIRSVRERWPGITTFHLHLHDGRGTAPVSAYAALEELDARHTLIIDSSIGGMGGCPYCGNGRATKMIPTEDLVSLLDGEGIDTGIDLDLLIEAAHLAEDAVGHELYGHVSKAGPRPTDEDLYPMDMPLVETLEHAQHFRLGPAVYEGAPAPWRSEITSPARDAVDQARKARR